ncbi:type I-MYXAN CRISPR-associated protein Cmx8 [Gloeobacter morelensis]|uniref:Type I-MYXAN CRISPR-associated protein Cmx8 n=1 Tax=Gloeobacter morelensis MG652769 TaxID=2781736 RepID=A0ABY3PQF6_9CYAN|nr:type I-MYXAN CRISPR-associated protein Cmx8 [Gloeobacter morelensis]UFP95945.1 type I-MYXAN CRISPR-associated protein Cmx8 [Gloeobacter morelensis MG652769]
MAKKKTAQTVDVLHLDYRLVELPSSQHRAGLAGLVLMLNWLKQQGKIRGVCELTALDEYGASVRLDCLGLEALLDEVYGASREIQERTQPFKNKNKEIVPPLEEREVSVTDPSNGKAKLKKVYLYPVVVPRGSFLAELDPTSDGNQGLWIKLWRDMIWAILRGVPATRAPFEARAEGKPADDARKLWEQLVQPAEFTVDLPSTYFLGAQAANADNVPFFDRARLQFLLHFWPFSAQVYVPAILDNEGKRQFVGYALAIPDVCRLETFCEELPSLLRERKGEKSGYRPREAVVCVAVESALDVCRRLRERLTQIEGGGSTRDLVMGIDVLHLEKQGNSVRLLGSTRLEPEAQMVDTYAQLRDVLWNDLFRRQQLLNLVQHQPRFAGFDALLSTLPIEQTFGSNTFRHDARQSFKYETDMNEDTLTEAIETIPIEENTEAVKQPLSEEELLYRLVQSYLLGKLQSKYRMKWDKDRKLPVQGSNPISLDEYRKAKEKIAKDAFLAIRSRTDREAFIEYFVATLCSVPQRFGQQYFVGLARALDQETDRIRTLTMLALSAQS